MQDNSASLTSQEGSTEAITRVADRKASHTYQGCDPWMLAEMAKLKLRPGSCFSVNVQPDRDFYWIFQDRDGNNLAYWTTIDSYRRYCATYGTPFGSTTWMYARPDGCESYYGESPVRHITATAGPGGWPL